MPQIRKTSLSFAVVSSLLVLALSGCGDVNSQANLDNTTGKHVTGWLLNGHNTAARADLDGCTDCHGTAFDGGIAKVACSTCHTFGTISVHPARWGNLAYASHAGYVADNGNASCATNVCHGTDLSGVAGSGPSCAVNCHMAGTALAPQTHAWVANSTAAHIGAHRAYFNDNFAESAWAAEINRSCRNNACHGSNLTGAFASGPSCSSVGCHGSGNPLPN